MIFSADSRIVKSYVLLINNFETTNYTIDNVPDLYNLREVVQSVLDSQIV